MQLKNQHGHDVIYYNKCPESTCNKDDLDQQEEEEFLNISKHALNTNHLIADL